jgi:hypothetical protein
MENEQLKAIVTAILMSGSNTLRKVIEIEDFQRIAKRVISDAHAESLSDDWAEIESL